MIKKFKNQEGFTLVEAIISIATLAIISGFILQMFIVSDKVNNKAYVLDQCTSIAVNTVELIKSESPQAYEFYEDCYRGDYADKIVFYKGYDEDFQTVSLKDAPDNNHFPPEAKYVLETELIVNEPVGADTIISASSTKGEAEYVKETGSGNMCDINVSMYENYSQNEETVDKMIFSKINTTHYFSNGVIKDTID